MIPLVKRLFTKKQGLCVLKKVKKGRQNPCLGSLAYLFQNQEVTSHTGNLIIICLMQDGEVEDIYL
jgi:hypothetical protein